MIIVFVGLSTSGKTNIVKIFQGVETNFCIKDSTKERIRSLGYLNKFTTSTTRKMRENEIANIDYYFLSKEEFNKKIINNDFCEYSEVYGNYYGLTKSEVDSKIYSLSNFSLIMDPQGVEKIKKIYPDDVYSIYLDVSIDTILHRMGLERSANDNVKDRIRDMDYFLDYKSKCDCVIDANQDMDKIINDILDKLEFKL